jgi:nucleotidyltransferase/DNA polymerase involved in DNA repair
LGKRQKSKSELAALANIGPAMLQTLDLLGLSTIQQLAVQDADVLYHRLEELTGVRHDPCVWDTFRAAIHEAKTGEKTKWWDWTPERKARQAQGKF